MGHLSKCQYPIHSPARATVKAAQASMRVLITQTVEKGASPRADDNHESSLAWEDKEEHLVQEV